MDSRNLDLSLLVTLEALLAERNVTKAARRLNLSQPALSARLSRLREILGDSLLLPAQRGMIPTQRALELQKPLHEALEEVRRVISDGAPIEPRTTRATVVIAASDYVQYSLLIRLSCVLRQEAPLIRIAWRTLDIPALAMQLERGEVDLALATLDHAPDAMCVSRLYAEEYVAIIGRGHPQVQGSLNLDVFCKLDHVVVSPQGGGFSGPTDLALEAVGRRRSVALSASGFLIVPEIIARSDMVALVPRKIVEGWSDRLQILAPPLPVPGFVVASIWHDRTTSHPVQRWLRQRLADLTRRTSSCAGNVN